MAIQYAIPTIVSKAILAVLQKRLVYRGFFNSDYIGDASGGTVRIIGVNSASVGAYTRNNEITYAALTDTKNDLALDQSDYFAIRIDELDRVQESPELLAACAKDAVYQLDDAIDQYLADVAMAGSTLDPLTTDESALDINSSNALSTLVRMARYLDEADVPREGRIAALPPWYLEDLILAKVDLKDGAEAFTNGFVGRAAGFDIRVTNNVPTDYIVDGDADCVIAGSDIAATACVQVEKVEKIRLVDYIADGLRGVTAYGGKVTRPTKIAHLFCNEAAEAE